MTLFFISTMVNIMFLDLNLELGYIIQDTHSNTVYDNEQLYL
jgi:hypothetical protein